MSECSAQKCVPVHTMMAYSWTELQLHSFINSVADGGAWFSRPGSFIAGRETRYPLYSRTGGGTRAGLDVLEERRKSVAPTGIPTPKCPTHSPVTLPTTPLRLPICSGLLC